MKTPIVSRVAARPVPGSSRTTNKSLACWLSILFVAASLTFGIQAAPLTMSWRAEATSGNFNDPTAWWEGSSAKAPAGNEILTFDNINQLLTTNNLTGSATNRHRILFLPGSGPRTISGTIPNTFFDYSGAAPMIENTSYSSASLAFPFAIGYTYMEINPVAADISLGSTVNLGTGQLRVWGDNGHILTLDPGAILSGSGTVAINENSKVIIQSSSSYTGDTFINAGVLQVDSGGVPGRGTLRLGDLTGAPSAVLLLSASTVTTNAVVVRAGSSGQKLVGSGATSGSTTLSGSMTLDDNLTITNTSGGTLNVYGNVDVKKQVLSVLADGSVTFTGAVKTTTGPGALVKGGSGTLTFSGSADNTSLGLTVNEGTLVLAKSSSSTIRSASKVNINEGATLKIGGSGSSQLANTSSVAIASGGLFDLGGNDAHADMFNCSGIVTNSGVKLSTLYVGEFNGFSTIDGVILDGGNAGARVGVYKQGLGTVALTGTNHYTGGTRVDRGRLITTTSSSGGGAYLIDGSGACTQTVFLASPGASLNMSVLSNSTAAVLDLNFSSFGPQSTPVIWATSMMVTASLRLSCSGGNFSTGQFPLIKYGTLGGDRGFADILPQVSLPGGVSGNLVNNTSSKTIDLKITAATNLVWDGTANSTWNTASANWKGGLTYGETFNGGNAVLFNDALSVAAATNISLQTTVSPWAVTVDCSTRNYTITNTGRIGGYGNLTKLGSGKLTVRNAAGNTYAGETIVAGGVLEILHGNALGATNRGTVVNGGACLQLNGGITTAPEPLVLSGTGFASGGALRNIGGTNIFTGPISLTGATVRIQVDTGAMTLNSVAPIDGGSTALELNSGGTLMLTSGVDAGDVTKTGSGAVVLAGDNTLNSMTVTAGTLCLDGTNQSNSELLIGATGTWTGTGLNEGPVVLNGMASPTGTGRLRSGAQMWNAGGRFLVEMANPTATAGVGWDLLDTADGIDIQSTPQTPFTIKFVSLSNGVAGCAPGFNADSAYVWPVVAVADAVTNFDTGRLLLDTTQFSNDLAGGTFFLETNSGVQVRFTNNHAPTATGATLTRASGTSIKISVADLLATWTADADGDLRELVSLGSTSAGGNVWHDGTWIYYTPPAGDGDDAFTYTIKDARSYRSGDTVRMASALISLTKVRIAAAARHITISGGSASMQFAGIPGYVYDVERSIDLETWSVLTAVTNPVSGVFSFTDNSPPPNAAYYRLRQH